MAYKKIFQSYQNLLENDIKKNSFYKESAALTILKDKLNGKNYEIKNCVNISYKLFKLN